MFVKKLLSQHTSCRSVRNFSTCNLSQYLAPFMVSFLLELTDLPSTSRPSRLALRHGCFLSPATTKSPARKTQSAELGRKKEEENQNFQVELKRKTMRFCIGLEGCESSLGYFGYNAKGRRSQPPHQKGLGPGDIYTRTHTDTTRSFQQPRIVYMNGQRARALYCVTHPYMRKKNAKLRLGSTKIKKILPGFNARGMAKEVSLTPTHLGKQS